MSTVRLISYQEAGPEVRAVFDDIQQTRGVEDVNRFWKALANHPALLREVWEEVKAVMAPGALDPLVKEMIYVAVSATNGCEYCTYSHTAAARAKGMTEEMLGELLAVVALANKTNRLANAYRGFVNSHKKGFWVSRQRNPHPEKDVVACDVVTGGTGAIPIIVGITVEAPEQPVPGTRSLFDGRGEDAAQLSGWGGSSFAIAAGQGRDPARAAMHLTLEPNAQDWSGATIRFAAPVPLTPELRAGHLEFWVRGAADEWGRGVARQQLQINGGQSNPSDGRHRVGPFTWWDLPEPVHPERWVRARIPLSRLLAGRDDLASFDILTFHSPVKLFHDLQSTDHPFSRAPLARIRRNHSGRKWIRRNLDVRRGCP